MRTLRGRIGLTLLVFALVTLMAMGGAVWVSLRDLHQDAAAGALAELTIPYAVRAGQQLPAEALRRRSPNDRPTREVVDWLRDSQAGGRAIAEFTAFVREAQDEIDAAGITVMLVQDGSSVVRSPASGEIGIVDDLSPLTLPESGGEVVTGKSQMAEIGPVLYAATSIRRPRADRELPVLVLMREDNSAALATADLVRALTLAGLVLLVVGIPMAVGLSRSVTRPLRRLSAATADVAAGKVPEPLPTSGPLEVAEASTAFNAMAAEVDATREAQRQLLADIRHDLRTPLTVIAGFSEALRDGTASGESAVRAAEAISDEAGRLERMLDDLDHLTVPGVASPPLRVESVDSLEVARAAVDRFAAEAESRDQQLLVADDAAGGTLTADRDALDRILGNLIDNALRHAPAPGGHVTLELTASAGESRWRCWMTAPASPVPPSPTCSTASTGVTPRAPTVVPAWAWPSCVTWRKPSAVKCSPRTW